MDPPAHFYSILNSESYPDFRMKFRCGKWTPLSKIDHYPDSSGKINRVSVSSRKFLIMMQMCKDNQKWELIEIKTHEDMIIKLRRNN